MLLTVYGSSPKVRDMALKSLYYRFAVEMKVDVQHRLSSQTRGYSTSDCVKSSCCCAGCNMPPNIEETETVLVVIQRRPPGVRV